MKVNSPVKSFTLGELCALVGGKLDGDGGVVIYGVAGIAEAKEGEITFVANVKYAPYISRTKASAIIVHPQTDHASIPAIITNNPYLAFSIILEKFAPPPLEVPVGVSSYALVPATAQLGERVAIAPFVVVGEEASIGSGTVIGAGCYIGDRVRIGKECYLYPQVILREGTELGDRVIIHCGTVVGSDGFGYAQTPQGHYKVPQIGVVIIEDDVEIGANVTIDRATMGATLIGLVPM